MFGNESISASLWRSLLSFECSHVAIWPTRYECNVEFAEVSLPTVNWCPTFRVENRDTVLLTHLLSQWAVYIWFNRKCFVVIARRSRVSESTSEAMAATNVQPDAAVPASPSRPPRHQLDRRLRVIRNELRELDAQLKKLNEEFCGLRMRECVSVPYWINALGCDTRGDRTNPRGPSGAQCFSLSARESNPTLGTRISFSHTHTYTYTHTLTHTHTHFLSYSFIRASLHLYGRCSSSTAERFPICDDRPLDGYANSPFMLSAEIDWRDATRAARARSWSGHSRAVAPRLRLVRGLRGFLFARTQLARAALSRLFFDVLFGRFCGSASETRARASGAAARREQHLLDVLDDERLARLAFHVRVARATRSRGPARQRTRSAAAAAAAATFRLWQLAQIRSAAAAF